MGSSHTHTLILVHVLVLACLHLPGVALVAQQRLATPLRATTLRAHVLAPPVDFLR